MSNPIKTNAEILADQHAFQEAYARAQAYFAGFEGVAGVGFGQKQTSDQYKDDIVIVVFVQEKKPLDQVPPEQQIPDSFEGYGTDVRVVRRASFDVCDNSTEYDMIQGGIQISTRADPQSGLFGKGTLGCIVKKRQDNSRENVYLLTNKHVLFEHGSRADDYIYHPFPPTPDEKKFGKPGPSTALGPILDTAQLGNKTYTPPPGTPPPAPLPPGTPPPPGPPTSGSYFVDCAIARINIDSKCFNSTCTKDDITYLEQILDLQLTDANTNQKVNTIKDVRSVINDTTIIGQKVYKVGRTSGKTVGIVRLVNSATETPPDPSIPNGPKINAVGTIEIDFDTDSTPNGLNCKGHARFAEPGDSGSLVLDEQGRAIGLHSLGPNPGDVGPISSHACHIIPVLDALNICIPTAGGTSYGSAGATDGSGLLPKQASTASSEQVEGEIAFASQAVAGVLSPGFPVAAPADEDARRRLYGVRDALCATQKGRELHDAFVHVRREIGYLVRNSRPVKVVWHRNKGPAFFAHILNHLRGDTNRIPEDVEGVTLGTLLVRMSAALSAHGSNQLSAALDQHGADVLAIVKSGSCAQDYLAYLQQKEAA